MSLLPDFLREAEPRLRRSLLWSTADAALFCVMDGLGGVALPFYAKALGMSTLAIGLLASAPLLAGSLSQLLSPHLERLCGSRKRAVLLGTWAHAAVWLLLPGVAALPPGRGREAALLALVSAGVVGWFISVPSWASWMGDLIPPAMRPRYLAWRAVPCQVFSIFAILGMGEWMQAHDGPGEIAAFQTLFVLAAVFRGLSATSLAFQHEPAVSEAQPPAADGDPPAEGLVRAAVFFSAFHLVFFVSAPYFAPYMQDVKLGYRHIAWLLAMTPLSKMLFLPAWGRAAERYGNRRVILVSAALTCLLPLLWMLSTDWRWLLAVQALNGMIWGGLELCELPYLWDHTSPAERTRKSAGYFSLRSLCDCLGAVLGDRAAGLHAVRLPEGGMPAAYRFVFLLSGLGRLGVVLWGWRSLRDRQPERRKAGPRRVLAEVLTLRVLLALLLPAMALGDSVTLESGRTLEGRVSAETEASLTLETFGGTRTLPKDRIAQRDPKAGKAFAQYEARAQAGEDDLAVQLELLRLCLRQKGYLRAGRHLERARMLGPGDPRVAEAAKDLEKAEAAWRKTLPKPVGVVLKVGTAQVLTEEETEGLVREVRASTALLFRITGGGLYISEVVVERGTPRGHLVYDKTFTGIPNGTANIPMGIQNWGAPIIVHEMGHAVWGLPDDDNAGNGGTWGESKYPCIMAHQWDQGFGKCCRTLLANLYRRERMAELLDRTEEEVEGPVPEMKVTVRDAKRKP